MEELYFGLSLRSQEENVAVVHISPREGILATNNYQRDYHWIKQSFENVTQNNNATQSC